MLISSRKKKQRFIATSRWVFDQTTCHHCLAKSFHKMNHYTKYRIVWEWDPSEVPGLGKSPHIRVLPPGIPPGSHCKNQGRASQCSSGAGKTIFGIYTPGGVFFPRRAYSPRKRSYQILEWPGKGPSSLPISCQGVEAPQGDSCVSTAAGPVGVSMLLKDKQWYLRFQGSKIIEITLIFLWVSITQLCKFRTSLTLRHWSRTLAVPLLRPAMLTLAPSHLWTTGGRPGHLCLSSPLPHSPASESFYYVKLGRQYWN